MSLNLELIHRTLGEIPEHLSVNRRHGCGSSASNQPRALSAYALGVIRMKTRDLNARWGLKSSEEERKGERRVISSPTASPVTGIPSSGRDVPSSTSSSFLLLSVPSTSFPAFTCRESRSHERGLFSTRRVQQTPVTIVPLWREAYNFNMLSSRERDRWQYRLDGPFLSNGVQT